MLRLDMHMIAGVLQYVAVASFAEAWIENLLSSIFCFCLMSPPSRRRGLKTSKCTFICASIIVASFAEAWIEKISVRPAFINLPASPPSRRRGLKTLNAPLNPFTALSPPSRRRGLKTLYSPAHRQRVLSPPSRRRGLKSTAGQQTVKARPTSPPSRRRGLKTTTYSCLHLLKFVASFAEAWIENLMPFSTSVAFSSPPSRRRGLKS